MSLFKPQKVLNLKEEWIVHGLMVFSKCITLYTLREGVVKKYFRFGEGNY